VSDTVREVSDITQARRELRLDMRRRRAELDDDDQAAATMAVMARLARVPTLRTATLVAGYRAVRGEVDIDASLILLAERGTAITVPRVNGEHLEFVRWTPEQTTEAGAFGIPEPTGGDVVALERHDVVLTPLVAFDAAGNRLGQGGGFYDRALARCGERRPTVIGVAHAFQQIDHVPVEAWDVAIDAVVTEEGVMEFRPAALDPGI
jgi:5-formyltetrahydrofolate cyclo-ligase